MVTEGGGNLASTFGSAVGPHPVQTFENVGLPFPLFLAPLAHAIVDPPGSCVVCNEAAPFRFAEACYSCLRAGKGRTVNTELGMVRPEDAEQGWTHGIPLDNPSQLPDFDLVPHAVDPNFPDEQWYHVRIAPEYLQELIRTPRYHSWQCERWLFCCRRPSAFLGSVPSELILREGRSPIDSIGEWLPAPDWEAAVSGNFGSHAFYVFRCLECGRIRSYDDCD